MSTGMIVVKTIKHYECKNLRDILDSYATHILTSPSCIARILGLYRIQLKGCGNIYFLVSKNVYKQSGEGIKMTQSFDLKGSTVGRMRSPTSSVLKDQDLLNSGQRLHLGKARSVLLSTLARDVAFLSRRGLMDYSLLTQVEASPHTSDSRHSAFFQRFVDRVLSPRVPQPVVDRYAQLCWPRW